MSPDPVSPLSRSANESSSPAPRRYGVVAVIEYDGRFLTIKRAAGIVAPGALCFPGGGIETGESAEEALRRECREELGIEVEPEREIWENTTPWNVHLRWWTAGISDPRFREIPAMTPDPAEVAAVYWMSLEEMAAQPNLLVSNIPFLEFQKKLSRHS